MASFAVSTCIYINFKFIRPPKLLSTVTWSLLFNYICLVIVLLSCCYAQKIDGFENY